MVLQHTSYRAFLKAELADRIARNPAFSLRAFARYLDISPATLSMVLRGRKNLSERSAAKVARRIGLSADHAEYFSLLVRLEATRDAELRASLLERLGTFVRARPVEDLGVDSFKLIADWYHLPLLMMTGLSGFELTASSASARLGITRLEAEVAIERLERLGLLRRDVAGRLARERDYIRVASKAPNQALRSFHRQMLGRAIASLEEQTPEEKLVSSETLAIDPKHLSEAEAILDRCTEAIRALSERPGSPAEVYHLGLQFFRVTRPQAVRSGKS